MTNQVKSDIDIANEAQLDDIAKIVGRLDIRENEWEPYGRYKAKLSLDIFERLADKQDGQIILVTSINPTPAGEGKSTVTVGLGQALNKLGKQAVIALREPSLGPTMGMKGGATGGGYAQVMPMEEINLHFTGDFHAITTANNALATFIDNHIYQGNECQIDPRRIVWKRVLDLNDRALRQVVVGLGGPVQGVPREDGFQITVASEIMAVLCLARDLQDLKERLSRIVVAYTYNKEPVTVADLGVEGALTLLLKDALKPNLVQTLENTPALIHGGPFANIAHGCNSLIATKMAAKLGEYVVTEAGFGADLGAEKFLNIKARYGEFTPSVAVIVATVRALKMHGGVDKTNLGAENIQALQAGLQNLAKHIDTVGRFGLPVVVAINRFNTDTPAELALIENWCTGENIKGALTDVWAKGGAGGVALAEKVLEVLGSVESKFKPLYPLETSLREKIETIAKVVYGAKGVSFTSKAEKQLEEFVHHGWEHLPVCMAKTQYSLSDDPRLVGRPENFTITVRELRASIGAGFIVALTGEMLTMPGLPKRPAALNMDVDKAGRAIGLS